MGHQGRSVRLTKGCGINFPLPSSGNAADADAARAAGMAAAALVRGAREGCTQKRGQETRQIGGLRWLTS